ncbi:TetR/AcrR family transcriptional regulator [Catellatospora tritici]|uniref:TetR/AcrR family transcriptional regulator n=1 Tax=Catellatospora tritici TaxID=2851566 RepID=UPI001C2D8F9A|nr:TetR family transcriptional regulator [Catellatospora tritici]MBV1849310.1 TetR/AcrR family transcriptional regulator [Catellatospora tritici]
METTITLRERKKEATRQSLHEATLRLALERGFDTVTVDAIADEANVSRRTFSNYFINKEDALLYGDRARIDGLLARLRARPADEPPWQALTRSAAAQFAQRREPDPNWLGQLRLLRRHPSLLAQQAAIQSAFEQDLAAEIAARDPDHDDPMRSRIMAAVFLATIRTVTAQWTEQKTRSSLADAIQTGLACAGDRFA